MLRRSLPCLIAAIQWREQQRRSHDAAWRAGSVRATLAAPSGILRVSVGVPEVARETGYSGEKVEPSGVCQMAKSTPVK
jgi:hypothetical protein